MTCTRMWLVFLFLPGVANAAVPAMGDCPNSLHGHAIREVELLDGDPRDQAILVPDGETEDHRAFWNVTTDRNGWFKVRCLYSATKDAVIVPVPAGARRCQPGGQLGGASGRNVVCE